MTPPQAKLDASANPCNWRHFVAESFLVHRLGIGCFDTAAILLPVGQEVIWNNRVPINPQFPQVLHDDLPQLSGRGKPAQNINDPGSNGSYIPLSRRLHEATEMWN